MFRRVGPGPELVDLEVGRDVVFLHHRRCILASGAI